MDICAVPLGENSQFQAISESRGYSLPFSANKYTNINTKGGQPLAVLSPDDGQSWSKLVGNNKIKIQVSFPSTWSEDLFLP